MSVIISSFIPFPNIAWWQAAVKANTVIFDSAEHFEKMSYRNKYHITGANGTITLSIPLVKGREQRSPMKDVLISNTERWQVQHWRTLVSVYKRSPYFDHYEPSLQRLFDTSFTHLSAYNLATIHWLKEQLGLKFEEQYADEYKKQYESSTDLRSMKPADRNIQETPKYYQLFEERNGFMPNLSMLDLLFSEGPASIALLRGNF